MEEMRFANVAGDIQVDEAAFAGDMANIVPANRHYIIFFTPRSGSSGLTSILSGTKKLGFPEEYINPDFLPAVMKATNARRADRNAQAPPEIGERGLWVGSSRN
jgi:hypothetical protein